MYNLKFFSSFGRHLPPYPGGGALKFGGGLPPKGGWPPMYACGGPLPFIMLGGG